jgi:hypothetical protein
MRTLAKLLGVVVATLPVAWVFAQTKTPSPTTSPQQKPVPACVGKWQGYASTGPSKIAQTMDGDQLYKLQISKAFMKSVVYKLEILPDSTFKAIVTGTEIPRRRSKGTWKLDGNLLTLNTTEEQGVKTSRTLNAMLSSDAKKFVVQIQNKLGLPYTKLIFQRDTTEIQGKKR